MKGSWTTTPAPAHSARQATVIEQAREQPSNAGRQPRRKPFTVVLTGGIASGKTAAANYFASLGVPVLDTDQIARELVEPDSPLLNHIVKVFGRTILRPDGELDRRRMRELVFGDPAARKRLESIMHPAIAEVVTKRLEAIESPYCLLVVPLFFESRSYAWADRVLVVDVPEHTQIERVMSRDNVSRSIAQSILEAQASREQRKSIADDIIDNSRSLDELERQVARLHGDYMKLAQS